MIDKLPHNLHVDIKAFCEANNIVDVDAFIIKLLVTGFNIEKYGIKPHVKKTEKVEVKVPIVEEPIIEEIEVEEEIKEEVKEIIEIKKENLDLYGE
jgi:hypothetical protein